MGRFILPKRRLIVPALAAGVLAAPAIILAPRLVEALQIAGVSKPSRFTDIGALPAKQQAAVRQAMMFASKMSGLMGGGRVPAKTLAVRGTATSTSGSITIPAATQAGDIIILFQWSRANSGSVNLDTAPSGDGTVVTPAWSFFGGGSIGGTPTSICNIWWGVATASAASTSISGASDDNDRKAMLVLYGDVPIIQTDIGLLADVDTGTDNNPTGGTLTTGSRQPPLVAFCGFASSGVISPRTFSPSADGNVSPGTNMYLDYKIYNSSPSDITVESDDEGTANYIIGGYIRIRQ